MTVKQELADLKKHIAAVEARSMELESKMINQAAVLESNIANLGAKLWANELDRQRLMDEIGRDLHQDMYDMRRLIGILQGHLLLALEDRLNESHAKIDALMAKLEQKEADVWQLTLWLKESFVKQTVDVDQMKKDLRKQRCQRPDCRMMVVYALKDQQDCCVAGPPHHAGTYKLARDTTAVPGKMSIHVFSSSHHLLQAVDKQRSSC